jgi:uncharacterized damage-inducible protein DinB
MALPSLLDETLETWQFARDGVIDEVRNLPQEALTSRAVTGARTIAEIVHHIAESGLLMSGELTRKDGDFRRQPYPEFLREYAGNMERPDAKDKLIPLLERTHDEGERQIRAAGETLLLQPIRQFNGKDARRLTWMHHGIGHEEYHRGQIAFAARLLGYRPALTKLIHGDE